MSKLLLKSAVLGGFVVFLWGMFSWMVLPLHQRCFHKFHHETRVASEIKANAPEKGMYVLPYTFDYGEHSSQEEMKKAIHMMDNGPFVFASVVPSGLGHKMGASLVRALIIQIIGAFIVSWMLLKTKSLSFRSRVSFVTLFGLGVGILGYLPSWNWLGFSVGYVLVNMLDLIISWSLAGLVIANILKTRASK